MMLIVDIAGIDFVEVVNYVRQLKAEKSKSAIKPEKSAIIEATDATIQEPEIERNEGLDNEELPLLQNLSTSQERPQPQDDRNDSLPIKRTGRFIKEADHKIIYKIIKENPFISLRILRDKLKTDVSVQTLRIRLAELGCVYSWGVVEPGQNRQMRGIVLTNEVSRKLCELIEQDPQVSKEQLIRKLGLNVSPVSMAGYLRKLGFARCWTPPERLPATKSKSGLFSRETEQKIYEIIKADPFLSVQQLLDKLEINTSKANLLYHLYRRGYIFGLARHDRTRTKRESIFTAEMNREIYRLVKENPLITEQQIIDKLDVKPSKVRLTLQMGKLGIARCWKLPETDRLIRPVDLR